MRTRKLIAATLMCGTALVGLGSVAGAVEVPWSDHDHRFEEVKVTYDRPGPLRLNLGDPFLLG